MTQKKKKKKKKRQRVRTRMNGGKKSVLGQDAARPPRPSPPARKKAPSSVRGRGEKSRLPLGDASARQGVDRKKGKKRLAIRGKGAE